MSTHFTRRSFISTSALGLAALSTARAQSQNGKLQHACIGVGGIGAADMKNFMAHDKLQIVALCDVDRSRLEAASKLVPGARLYTDWRELIAKEGDKIDSLNASVPDHMHAAITMTALAAKKHVYCQKPLCHDVAECRAVANATRQAGVVTQLGTQYASGVGDRLAVQLLRQGAIGKVKRALLCSNRTNAIQQYRLVGPRPAQTENPPAHLDWDLWLGTAPARPYASDIYHPMKWRAWQDFGTGWSGDIGCHIFDALWKGLGLTAPRTIVAEVQKSWQDSAERRADTWPQSDHITWTFPGNDMTDGDELTVEWFDGEMFPPEEVRKLSDMAKYPEESLMVIGTEGAMLLPHQSAPRLYPKEKFKGYAYPKLEQRNHYHHFVDACLGGEKTESHFEQTAPMTEAILLGTVAIRVPGEVLQWNAPDMKIANNATAQGLLKRTYRDGWKVAGL
ncbi:MAG TPA: Gfo/Idh/MocA family oxidoreductase [Luteolibacter sp.]|nr:Gfo/Idh/MocA family oxidoreductase [Luteolibacter sp.]